MNMRAYLDSLRGKTVAVIGIGVSNTPLVKLLCREGISVTACDRRSRADLGELAGELEGAGAALQLGDGYLENLTQDVIFRTPGLRPDVPQLREAVARGSVLTSEMEEFFHVCPCPIIAVTGSDGKTTTTTIIAELLRAAGKTVHVGGNIGHPLLCEAGEMAQTDWAVLELSSFQLMTMDLSPHIAVMTNLAPNHLDVHKSMEEYIAAKENVYLHQSPSGKLVVNMDNAITHSFVGKAKGRVEEFSRFGIPENGVYLQDGTIYRNGKKIMDAADIRIPGVHNIENYMAAACAVEGFASDADIDAVACSFGGVEHRIELVRELDGVRYYNDSIASSPTRTIAGLHSFDRRVILIAGGYDKHIPFDALGPEICAHVRLLILCGATADKIRAAVEGAPEYAKGQPEIVTVQSLGDAVELAHMRAQRGDIVTLSPACAAFDQFKNFMVRGESYKKMVAALK